MNYLTKLFIASLLLVLCFSSILLEAFSLERSVLASVATNNSGYQEHLAVYDTTNQLATVEHTKEIYGNALTTEDFSAFAPLWQLGTGRFNTVAISPDRVILAIGTSTGVQLYDLSTLRLLKTLEGHYVRAITWSPDSKYLVSIGHDERIRVWHVATGEMTAIHELIGFFAGVSWQSGSDGIAVSTCGPFANDYIDELAFDTSNGTVGNINVGNCYRELSWSPVGRFFAGIYGEEVAIIDAYTEQRIEPLLDRDLGTPLFIAWAPDGDQLASVAFDPSGNLVLVVYDVSQSIAEVVAILDQNIWGHYLVWSPNGDFVALGTDTIQIWDIRQKSLFKQIDDVKGSVVAWLPDRYVFQEDDGSIVTISIDSLQILGSIRPNKMADFTWTSDGKKLWTIGDHQFAWDVKTGYPMLHSNFGGTAIAAAPNGHVVAYAQDNLIYLFSQEKQPLLIRDRSRTITYLAWSPDSQFLASSDINSSKIRIWDPQSGALLQTLTNTEDAGSTQSDLQQIYGLAWSPANKHLLVLNLSESTNFQLWNTQTWHQENSLKDVTANKFVFSPDGKKLALASIDTLTIWSTDDDTIIETWKLPIDDRIINSLDWSPDGKFLAIGEFHRTGAYTWGADDWHSQIYILDAATLETLATLQGHIGAIKKVQWSPDGTTIVSLGADETIKIWGSLPDQRLTVDLEKLENTDATRWLKESINSSFSPLGDLLSTAKDDGALEINELISYINTETGDLLNDVLPSVEIISPADNQIITSSVTFQWNSTYFPADYGRYNSRFDIEVLPVSQEAKNSLEYAEYLLSLRSFRSDVVSINLRDETKLQSGEYKWRLIWRLELIPGINQTSVARVYPLSEWYKFNFQPPPPLSIDTIDLVTPADGATVSGEVEFAWKYNRPLPTDDTLSICIERVGGDPITGGFCPNRNISGDTTSVVIDLKFHEDFDFCVAICSDETYEWGLYSDRDGLVSPLSQFYYVRDLAQTESGGLTIPKEAEELDSTTGQILPAPLYYTSDEEGQIFRIDPKTLRAEQITYEPAAIAQYTISPLDGSLIYRLDDVHGQIFRIMTDGSEQQQLTNEASKILEFAIAPTGDNLVYVVDTSPPSLIQIDANGENRIIKATAPIGATIRNLKFSPDGKHLVFDMEGVHLASSDKGTGYQKILTTVSAESEEYKVAWSPDSQALLIATEAGSSLPQLSIYFIQSEQVLEYPLPMDSLKEVIWSIDSKTIYWVSNIAATNITEVIYGLNISSGEITIIQLPSGLVRSAVWIDGVHCNSDGAIYFYAAEWPETSPTLEPAHLYRADILSGQVTRVNDAPKDSRHAYTEPIWEPEESGFAINEWNTLIWYAIDGTRLEIGGNGWNLQWGQPHRANNSNVIAVDAVKADINKLLEQWDVIHREALRQQLTSSLSDVLAKGALDQQIESVNSLKTNKCYWTVDVIEPSKVIEITLSSSTSASAQVLKNWDMDLVCNGTVDESPDSDGAFIATYTLELTADGWRIVDKSVKGVP